MKKKGLVSVIIPTYNCEAYLQECLDSVMGQTYKDIEVIVVDDGSTDNTKERIEGYTNKNDKISYHYQEHANANVARNTGLKIAKGEYFISVDADSILREKMLAKMVKTLQKKEEATFCYSNFTRTGLREGCLLTGPFDTNRLLSNNYVCAMSLVRNVDCVNWDENIGRLQDWDLWLNLWLNHQMIGVHIDEKLFDVVVRPKGTSGGSKVSLANARQAIRKKYSLKRRSFDTIVFDFDGVIFAETDEIKYESYRDLFAQEFGVTLPYHCCVKIGATESENISLLLDKYNIKGIDVEELKRARVPLIYNRLRYIEKPSEGLICLLNDCTKNSINLAIASGGSRWLIEHMLVKHGLDQYFPVIACGDDVANGKPKPDIYQLAMQKCGKYFDQCVAIEDSPNGVRSAHNAGIRCIGLGELEEADWWVKSLKEVNIKKLDKMI